MINQDVIDLYQRTPIDAKVVVLGRTDVTAGVIQIAKALKQAPPPAMLPRRTTKYFI